MMAHFVNLTNGLEWINDLPSYSFLRIESTAIEREEWTRILNDLDANFLMCLALGRECHVYDCGAGREVSKTISVGLPYIKNILTDLWLRDKEAVALTDEERAAKRKIKYYKRYLNTKKIHLVGHSRYTENDGDKELYRSLIVK